MKPLISVVMPTFNRQNYIVEAIESILNQTYDNFEFIIIDDCSKDNTYEIVLEYTKLDKRIKTLRNDKNMGIVYTLNRGLEQAKGKYIARMDDDDISLAQRFEKQIEFMEENKDIAILGSYVEIFDDNDKIYFPLMTESEPEILALIMNFGNPMGHSNIMMRKSFLDNFKLSYKQDYKDAEDYYLWTEILEKGGKIANIPEILVRYRSHANKISFVYHKHQQELVSKIINKQLTRFFNLEELKKIKLPFDCRMTNINNLYSFVTQMQKRDKAKIYSMQTYEKIISKYCGFKDTLNIVFIADIEDLQHLCASIASILLNSTELDGFCFYILNQNLDKKDKNLLENLKKLKEFKLEFIKVSEEILSLEQKELLFLEAFKLDVKRFIYIELGSIVQDSLNLFYHSEFKEKLVLACEEIKATSKTLNINLGHKKGFDTSVMLFNNTKIKQENILEKLLFEARILSLKKLLNLTNLLNINFKNEWLEISLRFNVSEAIYGENEASNKQDLHFAKNYAIVITYQTKPWHRACRHILWQKYWDYIKLTPFKKQYYTIYQQELKCSILGLYGAKERMIKQLSYRLGSELLSTKKQPLKVIILPFTLIKIALTHRKEQQIYKTLVAIEPKFKFKPLEDYLDFNEALKVKSRLSYQLGQAMLKHPLTFIFKVKGIYKEWKNKK